MRYSVSVSAYRGLFSRYSAHKYRSYGFSIRHVASAERITHAVIDRIAAKRYDSVAEKFEMAHFAYRDFFHDGGDVAVDLVENQVVVYVS